MALLRLCSCPSAGCARHGAAVVVDVVAALALAKTWTRWTKQAGLGVAGASGLVPFVFLTRKAILVDSG